MCATTKRSVVHNMEMELRRRKQYFVAKLVLMIFYTSSDNQSETSDIQGARFSRLNMEILKTVKDTILIRL